MPCIKCEQNKWKIGTGKCVYTTLQDCQRSLRAVKSRESNESNGNDSKNDKNYKK